MSSIFGRAIIVPKTNKSGGALAKGDVVIIDAANDNAVTTTTTAATTVTVGVVVEENGIANNSTGRVQFGGHVALVNVDASVTRGHYGTTHTDAKQAIDAGASRVVGAFCLFTTGGTTPEADLFTQPDGSSASGNVATDPIWDAAGDLAVGTGANTAAKLPIGNAGAALSRVNGAVAWNSGTGFPTAATGDRFWRTDLGMEFYYDGTRWLCTCAHDVPIPPYNDNVEQPFSNTNTVPLRLHLTTGVLDWYLIDVRCTLRVNTTNNGTNFWTVAVENDPTATTLGSVNTSADSANSILRKTIAVAASVGTSTERNLFIRLTKTLSPGTLDFLIASARWRYIGT